MHFLKEDYSRRDFIRNSSQYFSLLPFLPLPLMTRSEVDHSEEDLSIHVFSKHLQFLDFDDLALVTADLGFDGVELTVRKGGHVLPGSVMQNLPVAIDAIKKQGILANMIVTNITSLDGESASLIKTAADLGVAFYRLGYYRYPEDMTMPEAMEIFKVHMADLSKHNVEVGIQGCYQNHAGSVVGASIWEVSQLLANCNANGMGSQYDIRHAWVEGAASWHNGIRLIKERINTIVLKDFKWRKDNGTWQLVNTPLGEGMVDFRAYFKLLKHYNINVPVTIHFEYDLDGAEHGDRDLALASRKKVYKAMERDLRFAKELWKSV